MSDEHNTEVTEAENPETQSIDVDALKAEVDKWRSLSRKNEDRAKENAEAAKAWAEYQEASKSEDEKRATELEQLRSRAAKLEEDLAKKDREVLVQKVAGLKGVKPRYLFGDTEEELLASADEYLEDAKPLASKATGIIPSAGTGDPKVEASTLHEVRERAKAFAAKK